MPPPERTRVRLATPADAVSLAFTHLAAWRETYADVLPDLLDESPATTERTAFWSKLLAVPHSTGSTTVHVVEVDQRIVGFGSSGPQRTRSLNDAGYNGEICTLYLLKAFQRLGLGSCLLKAMVTSLTSRGFTGAALWALRDVFPARRFYERHGASRVAERLNVHRGVPLLEIAYAWPKLAT